MNILSRVLLFVATCVVCGSNGRAQGAGVPVFSPTRYMIVAGQIEQFDQKIKEFQRIVAVTKEQIGMLNRVSEAIQDVKRLAAGGVQGVVADFAKQAGIGDIMNTAMQFQALASDSVKLYNSVANLPDDARRQMEAIGLSAKNLQDYIAHGIRYDTMQTLDIDDWKAAAAHPHSMFTNGTLVNAMSRAQALTNSSDLRPAYAKYLKSLSPADRIRLAPQVGLDLAAVNFESWLNRTDERMKVLLTFQKTDEALTKALEKQDSYSEHVQKKLATEAAAARLDAEALRRKAEANGHQIASGSVVIDLQERLDAEAKAKQQASIVPAP